ncbi:MAG: acyl--CoA ligase [Alphaproteobacteria bacterium]
MLVHHFLVRTARSHGDRTALLVAGARHTFAEIDGDSDRLACELQALGVVRGDRVMVMLENSTEMVIALWATLKAGAVFVPVSPAVRDDRLAFLLEDSGARCVVAPARHRHRVVAAMANSPAPCDPVWVGPANGALPGERHLADILAQPHRFPTDPGLIDQDLCLIIYTSGSTGQPKGVMLTHRTIGNNVWSISSYLGNVADDVVLCVLPLSFDYGLFQILTGARVGFAVVLERSFAYPFEVLKRIGEHRVTGLPGVPTLFATLLQFAPFQGLDLSSLRYLSNTAAPFPPAHIQRLREELPWCRIFSMYGLTECTRVSYLDPERLETKITSVGRPMPNSEVYVVDDDGRRLAAGQVGELVVRGTSLMRGYWRRPEETARTLRAGEIPGEPVLHTGDLFRMDAEGDLYFVGRRDDVFKCRGEKVSPREVETVVFELADVAEAAVIGVPDPMDGMAVKLCLVAREGTTLDERTVRAHCRARLEPHLVPRIIEMCAALPKTDSGKISKSRLRAAAASAQE